MNLTKIKELNNKEYLTEIAKNTDVLVEYINETKGYVLELMHKNNVYINVDDLIEKGNIFSFNYILKNYDLEKEQIGKIKKFFKKNNATQIAKEVLTQEEIEEYLIEGRELNRNTVLTLETLRKFPKEIETQYDMDEYATKDILKKSVKKLTMEEFLTLDKKYLQNNLFLFEVNKNWFENESYAKIYVDLIRKETKRQENKLLLNNFTQYRFKEKDKELLEEILGGEESYWKPQYIDLNRFHGVTDLISKLEYAEKYNFATLAEFSKTEIKDNLEKIQEIFTNSLEDKNYKSIDEVFKYNIAEEEFKLILTQELFNTLIETKVLNFSYFNFSNSREDSSYVPKLKHVINLATNYLIETKEDIPIELVKSLLTNIEKYDHYSNNSHFRGNQEKKEARKIIFDKLLPGALKTENIKFYDLYLLGKDGDEFAAFAEKNPSINLLVIALIIFKKEVEQINKDKKEKKLELKGSDTIDSLISKFKKAETEGLLEYFNYKFNYLTNIKNLTTEKLETNAENNMIKADFSTDMEREIQLLSIFANENTRKKILSEKIKLDVSIFNEILKSKELNKFTKQYVENIKELLQNDDEYIKFFNENEKLKQKFKLNLKEENIENVYNRWIDSLQEEKKHYDKNREIEALPASYRDSRLKELFKQGKFTLIQRMAESSYVNIRELFRELVTGLNFEDLVKSMKDESFIKMVAETDYQEGAYIKFDHLKENQKAIIAELILPHLSDKVRIATFFSEGKREFFTKFAVEHLYKEVFYSYNFNVKGNESSYSKTYIDRNFTPEEIFEMFQKLDKSEGVFYNNTANADYDTFLDTISTRNNGDYEKLVEIAKEHSPKLYCLLNDARMYTASLEKDTSKTKDEREMEYFLNKVDIDLALQGLKDFVVEVKDRVSKKTNELHDKEGVNEGLLFKMIKRYCWQTYYEKRGSNFIDEYVSDIKEEDLNKIIGFLIENCPLALIDTNRIGEIKPCHHLQHSLYQYVSDTDKFFKNVFSENALCPSLSISGDGDSDKWMNQNAYAFIDGIINYAIENELKDELFYLSHSCQQNQFLSEEVESDYKYGVINYNPVFSFLCENEQLMNKLQKVTEKFFLDDILKKQIAKEVKPRKANKI